MLTELVDVENPFLIMVGPFPSQRIIHYTKWREQAEHLQVLFVCFLAVDGIYPAPSGSCCCVPHCEGLFV